jgi:hypothetical protein
MRNLKKMSGVIAAIILTGIFLPGCDHFSDCSYCEPGTQRRITITDLPAEYNGRWALITLNYHDGKPVAFGLNSRIELNNNSFTTELFCYECGKNFDAAFTSSGNWAVLLFITESSNGFYNDEFIFSGGTPLTVIMTEVNTRVSFNSLERVNL